MYVLLIKQFIRSKTVWLTLGILFLLSILSISSGKQFLSQKGAAISKTITQQQKHLETQLEYHPDDIGLLSYYLKFSFINPVNPLAGISIGQSDLNSHIQSVSITALEKQKHNTDLVNPMRQQVGHLDVSFLIIFLFPLVIIALNFNLLSGEVENGTWKMITIQAKSSFKYLIIKILVRFALVFIMLGLLFVGTKIALNIPLSSNFFAIVVLCVLYVVFWFALCFFIMLLRKSSNTNAIILLSSWLVLVVFLPVIVGNYITNKYPVDEAFTMVIKQRDAYHKKWDMDKIQTLDSFYQHYPHLQKYGYKTEGFSWLWYYAMQQMGDDDSKKEREALYAKIKKRERFSKQIAQFFPPLQLQLSLNEIAQTSLSNHVNFLNATTKFHEDIRLEIYPKVFEEHHPDAVDFEKYKPEFFKSKTNFNIIKNAVPMLTISILLISIAVFNNLKHFS